MVKLITVFLGCLVVLYVGCERPKKNEDAGSLSSNELITQTESIVADSTENDMENKVEVQPVEWEGLVETASMLVLPEFPKLAHEPENVDQQRLEGVEKMVIDGVEKDVLNIDLDLVHKLDEFIEQFSHEASSENIALFLGTWILHDENDVRLGDYEKKFDGQTTDITMSEKNGGKTLSWRKQLNNADLYFADNGSIYMFPGAPGGILGFFQLRLYGTKLYLYMLDKERWVLAPEHEGGKKYYVKYPLRELVFEW
jgi:hypothetical protein